MSENDIIVIDYTNWRGERALRRVWPFTGSIRFDSTEWHPEPQWIIDVFDVAKKERRIFAMKDIHSWVPGAAEPKAEVSA